ncbi:hypothetical protein AusDCA_0532 [Desulfitobacterium sp. AusDCA]
MASLCYESIVYLKRPSAKSFASVQEATITGLLRSSLISYILEVSLLSIAIDILQSKLRLYKRGFKASGEQAWAKLLLL